MRFSQNFLHYLSAHERCTERHRFKARGLAAREVELSIDYEVIKIRNMAWDVQREIYRMKGFVRLGTPGQSCHVWVHDAQAQNWHGGTPVFG
jgi:hypothetical protein